MRDAKMACTALSGLEGHLVVAIGTKLIVHSWDGEQLLPVAFYDTPLHTVTINTVKKFHPPRGSAQGGVLLPLERHAARKLLVQLAKDFEAMDVLATEFLVDGSTLSLLATDITGNAFVFAYDPKSVESWKGQKLLTKAAFHVGSRVHRMVRFRLKPPSGDSAPKTPAEQKAAANRHAVFFGTLDGGMGILVPVEEQIHSRLLTLQRHLNTSTPRPAGLNARTFRQAKTDEGRAMRAPAPHQVLDGELLSAFEHLPWRARPTPPPPRACRGTRRSSTSTKFPSEPRSCEEKRRTLHADANARFQRCHSRRTPARRRRPPFALLSHPRRRQQTRRSKLRSSSATCATPSATNVLGDRTIVGGEGGYPSKIGE